MPNETDSRDTPRRYRFRYYRGVKYVAPHGMKPPHFVRCGTCHRAWDDSRSTALTPTPAGRCPFEYWHRTRAPRKRRPLPAAGEWHTVSRDPFARHTLEARRVYDIGNADCKWCGQSKHTRATRTPYLFQFRVNPDAGRAHEVPALYCSVGCMRSYQS